MNSIVLITTAMEPPKEMPFLEMTNTATRQLTAKAAVFFYLFKKNLDNQVLKSRVIGKINLTLVQLI